MSEGRRARQGPISVVAAPGGAGGTRYGLVVGKRVGGAVERNRVKRRLRHAVTYISMEPNMDYVILADRPVVEAGFDDIVGWLNRALERLSQ